MRVLSIVVALIVLNFSLTFGNTWPTPTVTWRNEVSIELALLLIVLAVAHARGRVPTWLLGGLSAIWALLVAGHYVDVTAAALFGRELNLYWDLRYVPDVFALLARVAPAWMVASVGLGVVVVVVVGYTILRWAIGRVSSTMATPGVRAVGLAAASLALVVFGALRAAHPDPAGFGRPVIESYGRQAWLAARAVSGATTLPPSPPMTSDLERVGRADVLLVFLESYGAITFDRPEFARAIAGSREDLAAAIEQTDRRVVSAFVESPTFGGSSWLAHITLMSGIEVREPDTNALLMTANRDTLVTTFSRAGYRTLALMPGLTKRWPEGAFYGFDEIEPPRSGQSRFVFFPTISTHTPFRPTPPYQPDWPRVLTDEPFDERDLQRSFDEPVDWLDMGPAYAESIAYTHRSLAGYLRANEGRDLIVIVIGDHQPPALVTGEGAPWDVPVHIIASRPAILDDLLAHGFRPGLAPARPRLGRMHELLPILLQAFGGPIAPDAEAVFAPTASP